MLLRYTIKYTEFDIYQTEDSQVNATVYGHHHLRLRIQ